MRNVLEQVADIHWEITYVIYQVGFTVSEIALVAALAIFFCFRYVNLSSCMQIISI